MEEETIKPHKKTYDWLKQYQFQKGNNANPNGRPRGKSLKTFVREMLESMNDEDKAKYLKQLDPEFVWKMGEGNPEAKTDITSNGKTIVLPYEILNKHETNTSTEPNSEINQEV